MKPRTTLLALAGTVALALSCTGVGWEPVAPASSDPGKLTPVVFVPGVTGTKLRDPGTGKMVWGTTRNLLRPRNGGYELVLPLALGELRDASSGMAHPQSRYEASGPIWQLGLFGVKKQIYRPVVERFEREGYRLGELEAAEPTGDLFFYSYDWRRGNLESVRRLDRQLTMLSNGRDGLEVDLICQSNAAKICRWLVKYGPLDTNAAGAGETSPRAYRIRKLVLVGASNNGALRVLQQMNQGRSYFPVIGRRLHPETLFAIRPLFEDLPVDRGDLFFDENGRKVEVDLFDANSWVEFEWSIFGREATERLRRNPHADLFASDEDRLEYLRRQLEVARRSQLLLARDAGSFPDVQIFLLENRSAPTIDRALLTRDGESWRTWFAGDSRVDSDPLLRRLASKPGDGHASLASQRGLSPQETAAIAGRATVTGGHFEAIVGPEALEAMLEMLAKPTLADVRSADP